MEIELLPQVLKSKDVVGLTGIVEVFDGFALSDQKSKSILKMVFMIVKIIVMYMKRK